ncbi:MAG: hypothetical protein MUO21_08230, partial [Nitrososphaeraceae archaeon]|nr:hypothetical protein [Nitrososphaeraceae archaeon]
FAVGVNMPTKTVLFTELKKRDNNGYRMLLTHEYTQMSGRAGRRGLDKVGHVIHLPNLFEEPTTADIEKMLLGKSQYIKSKFSVDYQFVLKMIINNLGITDKTLLSKELNERIIYLNKRKVELEEYFIKNIIEEEDIKILGQYSKLKEIDPLIKLNKKDEKERLAKLLEIEKIMGFKSKYNRYQEYQDYKNDHMEVLHEIDFNETYIDYYVGKISNMLISDGYMVKDDKGYNKVTLKGTIASKIGDCNPILLTELILGGYFNTLIEEEIAAVLSIFLDTKVEGIEEVTDLNINHIKVPNCIKDIIKELKIVSNKYLDFEEANELFLNIDWNIYLSMMEVTYKWASGIEFKDLNIGTFEGNFVKDMIKITSICQTVEQIAEMLKDNELVVKIKKLETILMRDIVSIDSLYIL